AYETPLRDKTRGRIYRIAYIGARASAGASVSTTPALRSPSLPSGERAGVRGRTAMGLHNANPEQLVAALKNDNLFWRMTAQRLLVTRGRKDVVPALCQFLRDTSVDEIGLNPAAIHALWTLEGLGALDGSDKEATDAATGALKHPSAGVRRAAAMVLPGNAASLKALLAGK